MEREVLFFLDVLIVTNLMITLCLIDSVTLEADFLKRVYITDLETGEVSFQMLVRAILEQQILQSLLTKKATFKVILL